MKSFFVSFDEILKIVPDYFYKYFTINDNLKDVLRNGQLWLSSPAKFNDPFDCNAYLDFGKTAEDCKKNFEKLNKAFENSFSEVGQKIWDDLLSRPQDFNLIQSYSIAKNFAKWLGVICFTENYNNTLMWSHYANHHKGLVLEFRKNPNSNLTRQLFPVNYHKKYPIVNISELTEENMLSIAYQVISAKGYDWKYEKEWRAISSPGDKLYDFNKADLSGVIFGINTDDTIKKEIYELVNNSGYSNITFKEATFQSRSLIVTYEKYENNSG